MNMQRVRGNVERMLRRFESQQVTVYRPVRDAYGQPTHERVLIGMYECWMEAVNRPSKWQITESGARYDDEGAIWITLLWTADKQQVQHEDICVLTDGSEYDIKNIYSSGKVRMFWQLADRRDAQ